MITIVVILVVLVVVSYYLYKKEAETQDENEQLRKDMKATEKRRKYVKKIEDDVFSASSDSLDSSMQQYDRDDT